MKTKTLVAYMVGLILMLTPSMFAATPATRPNVERVNPLDLVLPVFEGTNKPVAELLRPIWETTNLNVVLAVKDFNEPHATLKMKEVTVRAALDALLANSGWDYEVQENNLYLFERGGTPAFLVRTETYNVGDLVDYADAAEMNSLIETIKATVDHSSWQENGGIIGSIRNVKGALVINQVPKNHRAIYELLAMLRIHKSDPSPSPRLQAAQMESKVQIVGNLKETCSDPQAMAIIAISELRAMGSAKPAEMIATLEFKLSQTKSLPLRNAIRLTLKDLYIETGDMTNVLIQLNAILAENDREKPLIPAAGTR